MLTVMGFPLHAFCSIYTLCLDLICRWLCMCLPKTSTNHTNNIIFLSFGWQDVRLLLIAWTLNQMHAHKRNARERHQPNTKRCEHSEWALLQPMYCCCGSNVTAFTIKRIMTIFVSQVLCVHFRWHSTQWNPLHKIDSGAHERFRNDWMNERIRKCHKRKWDRIICH